MPRLLVLLLLPTIAVFGLYGTPAAWAMIIVFNIVIIACALIDIVTLPSKRLMAIERRCPGVCSLNERHTVELRLENRSNQTYELSLKDDLLPGFVIKPDSFTLNLPADSRAVMTYFLMPKKRGTFHLEHTHVRGVSKWKFWKCDYRFDNPQRVVVYPALKQISRYALYAKLNQLQLLGVRRTRKIGTENEFERLREYSQDDSYKSIDWRATSRRNRLIVRDFQTDQSQRVVFLVDCGRMMVHEVQQLTLLDHAIDALLTLASVSLRNKDQVGLLTFSDRVLNWQSPASGRRQLNRLVHAAHDQHPELVESRYDLAFLHLSKYCRKRSLVILITNLIDEVNMNQVSSHLTNIVGKHLPLGVFLRHHEIFDAFQRGIDEREALARFQKKTEEANQSSSSKISRMGSNVVKRVRDATTSVGSGAMHVALAAGDILEWRAECILSLKQQGALVLDVFPEEMTAPLVNEYLKIKARHLL